MEENVIDVAQIMRDIKRRAAEKYGYEPESGADAGAVSGAGQDEMHRILDFVDNTCRLTDSLISEEPGIAVNYTKNVFSRKLTVLIKRLVRKATAFLRKWLRNVLAQINANMRGLMEGEQELIRRNRANEERIAELEGALQAVKEQLGKTDARLSGQIRNLDEAVNDNPVFSDEEYVAFENAYRGEGPDISDRLRFYFREYLDSCVPSDQRGNEIIVDLGCGRGEWLDLIDEYGYQGVGVDANRQMVDICCSKGRRAVCEDAEEYLAGLTDDSVIAITAFQLFEHLRPAKQKRMISEAFSKLKPGGYLILEVPNTKNIQVASDGFYSDVSHIRPVNSDYLLFLAKAAGFSESGIVCWKNAEIETWFNSVLAQESTSIMDSAVFRTVLNDFKNAFYTSPDYALVARK